MTAALLCGPCPPGACGVGDYTVGLAKVLAQKGIESQVISSGTWNLGSAVERLERFNRRAFDIVHIQYPTAGFGRTVAPQVLALIRRCVITLHETSGTHVLRKLSLLPFSIRPSQVVFPSKYEQEFALKWVPWISPVSCVIPIPSNIPGFQGETQRRFDEITYFGLIVPKKGLEKVISLAWLLQRAAPSLRVRIIGSCPPKESDYRAKLKSRTSTLPVIWDDDLTPEQVAERLASSSIAYLPYPDGVSERRASFQAALLNGVTVITTRGKHTPSSLEGVVNFCERPEEALSIVRRLIDNRHCWKLLSAKGKSYAQEFTWECVANAHLGLYERLLEKSKALAA